MKNKEKAEKVIKITYINNYVRMVATHFLAHKYHSDLSKINFEQIVKESNDEITLTQDEMELVKETSKWYLREYYNIEITNENPIKYSKLSPNR